MRIWIYSAILGLLALSVCHQTSSASDSDRLARVTEKWRQTHSNKRPIEYYLRDVVAADAQFNRDPGLVMDRLGEELQETYNSLGYLLNASLQAQFIGLSTDSLRHEWLRRYWKLRDPTPTTVLNERHREHERRVEVARNKYGWNEKPFWDARGRVYIIFGEPDSILSDVADVQEGIGYVAAWEEWLYLNEKWVAEFEKPNPRRPWVLGRTTRRLSSRPDLVEQDLRKLGYKDPLNNITPGGRERLGDIITQNEERQMLATKGIERSLSSDYLEHEIRTDFRARELLRKKKEGIYAFSKELESGTERFVINQEPKRVLWYVFDVDMFKGPPGRRRVEVHYQFNLQDLTFKWQDSLYVARYRVEALLQDRAIREVARDEHSEVLEATEFRSTTQSRLLPGQLSMNVVPGRYQLAIRFLDVESGDEGVYITDVDVPELTHDLLSLSDIEMATKIVPAPEKSQSRFLKHNRLVIPNPIGIYRKPRQFTGYFEIYGLTLDSDNTCRYKVSYSIVPRGQVRHEGWFQNSELVDKPFVESSFLAEGDSAHRIEELRIDIGFLEQDAYDIVLTVNDLIAQSETTTRSAFSILD